MKVPYYIRNAYESAITEAGTKIGAWLKPYGYDVLLCRDELPGNKRWIGMYESGSVFSGMIEIYVSEERIYKYLLPVWREYAYPKEMRAEDMADETAITFYHEVGHAILEQIIDWYENVPEIYEYVETKMMDRYFSVFDDAVFDEEILTENFARDFHAENKKNELRKCFDKLNNFIKTL